MEVADFTMLAAVICFIWLSAMLLKAALKFRPEQASAKGSVVSGIIYAFTFGMLPGSKESASQHILSYLAGIVFHIGIFTAFLFSAVIYLLSKDVIPDVPQWARLISVGLMAMGLANGIGLLIKRIINPRLRFISNLDDYFSNIIVNIFLGLSIILAVQSSNVILYIMYIFEASLLLYIPLGKLRHCAYFPATRIMFGYFYGYRGVLPPYKNNPEHER